MICSNILKGTNQPLVHYYLAKTESIVKGGT